MQSRRLAAPRSLPRPGSRVVAPAQLPGRVHRQLGAADVDGRDAEARRGDRPDGRAARHVVAGDEHLPRHAGPLAGARRTRAAVGGVGGVALVGVDLDAPGRRSAAAGGPARGARGSWGGRRGPCRPRRTSSRRARGGGRRRGRRRGPATMRSSTSRAAGRPRRWSLALPTSSWSNRRCTGDAVGRRRLAAAERRRRAAQHETQVVEAADGEQLAVDAEHAPAA